MANSAGLHGRLCAVLLCLAVAYTMAAGWSGSFHLDNRAIAQQTGNVPGAAQGNSSDAEIWRAIRQGAQGNVSIEDGKAGLMIQSEGENWRSFRNGPLPLYGGWALAVVIVLLAVFFAARGRIRIESGFSGKTVERFNEVERFAHWLVASSFIVLALTGLNLMYGRYVIKPILGADVFAAITLAGKYAHNFVGFAFMVGLVMILVIWIRDNIPDRHDLIWLLKGGGMFMKGVHPPAKKFNAGQKIVFWVVVLGGVSISVSGVALMFPFEFTLFGWSFKAMNLVGLDMPTSVTPIIEMQLSQLWHAILGLVLIALILAHIYIATLGMEGAYDAMGTGMVDENWAKEHHSLWATTQDEAKPADD